MSRPNSPAVLAVGSQPRKKARLLWPSEPRQRQRHRRLLVEQLEIRTLLTSYFVNDASLVHDEWATAVGNDANDGLTPATPKASVQAILSSYDLEPGDVVRIDTGTYNVTSNIFVGALDGGSAAGRVSFVASPYGVTINRSGTASGAAWEIAGSYVTVTTATSTKYPAVGQRWMVVTGGNDGIYVTGVHAELRRLDVNGSGRTGIRTYHDSGNNILIENVVVRNSTDTYGTGIHIQYSDAATVRNATVYGHKYAGVYFDCSNGSRLENTIVWANGAGSMAVYEYASATTVSDYNDLYATGGAAVGKVNSTYALNLAAWQTATGQDAHSLSTDPLFVDAAGGDFHLQSTAGSYHNGAWIADSGDSCGIDAGYGAVGLEPSPNSTPLHALNEGGLNLGAYGGTEQASHTPLTRRVWLRGPLGGEVFDTSPQNIRWTWAGQSWQPGDTISLASSSDSGLNWIPIAGGAGVAVATATYSWDLSTYASSPRYRVKAVPDQTPGQTNQSDYDFQIRVNGPITYYVNDGEIVHDEWATAVGNDANDGLTPATPKASVQAILSSYDLEPGDVVRIDTGTYNVTSNIFVGALDGGSAAGRVSFVASPYGVTINRSGTASGAAWEIVGSYVTVTTATSTKYPAVGQRWMVVTGGNDGIYVTGVHAELRRLDVNGSGRTGIRTYHDSGNNILIENVVVRNSTDTYGTGIHIQYSDAATVRNATVYGHKYAGVYFDCSNGSRLENTIVWANGAGSMAVYEYASATTVSDYNDLYATGGAAVGKVNSTYALNLAAWQTATGQDAHSLSTDPLFVDAAGGDFHLQSTAGSYHNGAWIADSGDSCGIDAGYGAVGLEPSPNSTPLHALNEGGLNLGAYGGTEQASHTPLTRRVWLRGPLGGEVFDTSPQNIRWTWAGQSWQPGDTISLASSSDSGLNWIPIAGGAGVAVATATYSWDLSTYASSPRYRVKAVPDQTPGQTNQSDYDFQIRVNGPITYYVNDGEIVHDEWATAVGNDANDGLTPATPKGSVQAILSSYDLEPGDVVRIDTGTYNVTSNIFVGALDGGSAAGRVSFVASPYGVTINRSGTASGAAWEIAGSYVTVTTATSTKYPAVGQRWMVVTGGNDGIYVTGEHAELRRLDVNGSGRTGIRTYHDSGNDILIENVVVRNSTDTYGTGIHIQYSDAATVRNATVYGHKYAGIYFDCSNGSRLENTIVWANGAGSMAVYEYASATTVSDYNDLYATGGAAVGKVSSTYALNLAAWQTATGQDAHSLSTDPLFVDAAGGDFHLKSNAGRYDPASGTWATDGNGEVGAARQCGLGARVAVVLGRDLGQHAGFDDGGGRFGDGGFAVLHRLPDGSGDRVRPGLHVGSDGNDRRCSGAGQLDRRPDAERTDVGDDAYVLLARVRFASTGEDDVPVDEAGGTSVLTTCGWRWMTARPAWWAPLNLRQVPELGGAPATELWAVVYDIDDNNQIDFGDFSFFAGAFGKLRDRPVRSRRLSGGRTSTRGRRAASISAIWRSSHPISTRTARRCNPVLRRWSSQATSRKLGDQERNERWTAPGLADAAGRSVAVERAQRFQRLGERGEGLEDVLSLLAERVPHRLADDVLVSLDALFARAGR
jgi:hypothetical protein